MTSRPLAPSSEDVETSPPRDVLNAIDDDSSSETHWARPPSLESTPPAGGVSLSNMSDLIEGMGINELIAQLDADGEGRIILENLRAFVLKVSVPSEPFSSTTSDNRNTVGLDQPDLGAFQQRVSASLKKKEHTVYLKSGDSIASAAGDVGEESSDTWQCNSQSDLYSSGEREELDEFEHRLKVSDTGSPNRATQGKEFCTINASEVQSREQRRKHNTSASPANLAKFQPNANCRINDQMSGALADEDCHQAGVALSLSTKSTDRNESYNDVNDRYNSISRLNSQATLSSGDVSSQLDIKRSSHHYDDNLEISQEPTEGMDVKELIAQLEAYGHRRVNLEVLQDFMLRASVPVEPSPSTTTDHRNNADLEHPDLDASPQQRIGAGLTEVHMGSSDNIALDVGDESADSNQTNSQPDFHSSEERGELNQFKRQVKASATCSPNTAAPRKEVTARYVNRMQSRSIVLQNNSRTSIAKSRLNANSRINDYVSRKLAQETTLQAGDLSSLPRQSTDEDCVSSSWGAYAGSSLGMSASSSLGMSASSSLRMHASSSWTRSPSMLHSRFSWSTPESCSSKTPTNSSSMISVADIDNSISRFKRLKRRHLQSQHFIACDVDVHEAQARITAINSHSNDTKQHFLVNSSTDSTESFGHRKSNFSNLLARKMTGVAHTKHVEVMNEEYGNPNEIPADNHMTPSNQNLISEDQRQGATRYRSEDNMKGSWNSSQPNTKKILEDRIKRKLASEVALSSTVVSLQSRKSSHHEDDYKSTISERDSVQSRLCGFESHILQSRHSNQGIDANISRSNDKASAGNEGTERDGGQLRLSGLKSNICQHALQATDGSLNGSTVETSAGNGVPKRDGALNRFESRILQKLRTTESPDARLSDSYHETSAVNGVTGAGITSANIEGRKQTSAPMPGDVEVGAVQVDEPAPELNSQFYRGRYQLSSTVTVLRRRRTDDVTVGSRLRRRRTDDVNAGAGLMQEQRSDAGSVLARRISIHSRLGIRRSIIRATLVEENEGEVVLAERMSFFERKWKVAAFSISIFLLILVVSLSILLSNGMTAAKDVGLMVLQTEAPSTQPSFPPSFDPRPMLETVQTRGHVRCGLWKRTIESREGFSIDLCRAVAAVLFGNPDNIIGVPVTVSTRFQLLSDRAIDVLTSSDTRTIEREVRERTTGVGFTFSSTYFYDGMAYFGHETHVKCAEERKRYNECYSLLICATWATTVYDYVQSSFPSDFYVAAYSTKEMTNMLMNDTCTVIAADRSILLYIQSNVNTTDRNFMVGNKLMTKEPLAIVTRNDDGEFSDVVNWVVQSLFYGEEQSLTKDLSKCQNYTSLTADVTDLIFSNAFYCVGNYGQILGAHHQNNRGMNQINDGTTGMLYAIPFGELEHRDGVLGDTDGIDDDALLARIRHGDSLNCGVFVPDGCTSGVTKSNLLQVIGMGIEYCHTLAAALFNGNHEAVTILSFSGKEINSFVALDNGTIDVLAGARIEQKYDFRSSLSLPRGFHFSTPYYYGNQTSGFYSLATRDDNVRFSTFVNCVIMATIFIEEKIKKQESTEMPKMSIFGSEFNWALRDAVAYSGGYDQIYTKNFGDVAREGRARNFLNDEGTPQMHSFPGIHQ